MDALTAVIVLCFFTTKREGKNSVDKRKKIMQTIWRFLHVLNKCTMWFGRGGDLEGQRCQSHAQRTKPRVGYISALERQTGILSGPLLSECHFLVGSISPRDFCNFFFYLSVSQIATPWLPKSLNSLWLANWISLGPLQWYRYWYDIALLCFCFYFFNLFSSLGSV